MHKFTSLMLICLKRCILINCQTRPSTSQHFFCSDLVIMMMTVLMVMTVMLIMMTVLIMMMLVMRVLMEVMLKDEVRPDVVRVDTDDDHADRAEEQIQLT